MFTGIIEELGEVAAIESRDAGSRLTIACERVLDGSPEGASIAVNGCCLTALGPGDGRFHADLAPETLRRTNLGNLRVGSRVNLERPLAAGDRLSGHIVQGHVDATGEFVSLKDLGAGNWWLTVRVPEELDRFLVYKGSIAIDGISLTVASVDDGLVGVTIIPHTFRHTTLGGYEVGAKVNIETDILAKHVEKLLGRLSL